MSRWYPPIAAIPQRAPRPGCGLMAHPPDSSPTNDRVLPRLRARRANQPRSGMPNRVGADLNGSKAWRVDAAEAGSGSPHFPLFVRWQKQPAGWNPPPGRCDEPTVRHHDAGGPGQTRRISHGCGRGESGRDTSAAATAARLQDRASGAILHPGTKPVLLLALPVVGLEGPLHAWPPRRGERAPHETRRRMSGVCKGGAGTWDLRVVVRSLATRRTSS